MIRRGWFVSLGILAIVAGCASLPGPLRIEEAAVETGATALSSAPGTLLARRNLDDLFEEDLVAYLASDDSPRRIGTSVLTTTSPHPGALSLWTPVRDSAAELHTAPLTAVPLPRDVDVNAGVAGGVIGLFIPQLYVWFADLTGTVRDGSTGTLIDVEQDLRLESQSETLMPLIQVNLGPLALRLSGFQFDFAGRNTLTRTIDFGGLQFQISEDVASTVSIENYKVTAGFRIIKTPFFAVGLQGGVNYYEFDATLSSSLTGTASASGAAPVPVLGVLAQARLWKFLFEVEVSGLSISFSDTNFDFLEIEATAGIILFKVFAIRGGYRSIDIDFEDSGLALDATLEGFFIGGSLQF